MLEPIKFFCNFALPAVYDESLSYYEVITKLAYKLNDTITALNTLTVSVTGDANTQELKANVTSIGYKDTGGISEFTQTETPVTNVKQAIAEANKGIKTLADGSFTNTDNLAVSVDANSVAIDNIDDKLKTVGVSLTGNSSDLTFSNNIYEISVGGSGFVPTLKNVTNLKAATSSFSLSVDRLAETINTTDASNIEKFEGINNKIDTINGQISDIDNWIDGHLSSDVLGWNNIGSGNIVFFLPVNTYVPFTQAFVKSYFKTIAHPLSDSTQIFITKLKLNSGSSSSTPLCTQIANAANDIPQYIRQNVTMVYAASDGTETAFDTESTVASIKTLFNEGCGFVLMPGGWFNGVDKNFPWTMYGSQGVNTVSNAWEYLIGTDVNTSNLPNETALAPYVLMDLFVFGDSNRSTKIYYTDLDHANNYSTNYGYILYKHGRAHRLLCASQELVGKNNFPFGKAYSEAFAFTRSIFFTMPFIPNVSADALKPFMPYVTDSLYDFSITANINYFPKAYDDEVEAPVTLTPYHQYQGL